jgi:mycofactocin system glycosyltransferase
VSDKASTDKAVIDRAVIENLPLPPGFRVELDADTRQLDSATLFGGSPARIMKLSAAGRAAFAELGVGPVGSAQAGQLARRLTDAGVGHPRPPAGDRSWDVTVLVPVRDRAELLARCLTAVGSGHPVLVVNDGSIEPVPVAEVVAEHGAQLVNRAVNGGPAAARNTGLAVIDSEFVAFLDSDCEPSAGWIDALAPHFADPMVAAVAPRVIAESGQDWAGLFTAANGNLDLGDRPARVLPSSRVGYVPTAALLVRRSALQQLAIAGFDERLRVGEDVDLIWRLHEAGWRVRYEPSVQVRHHEPSGWAALLSRRFSYGTSAGALATRHPKAMAPLALHPWPALAVAGLLARKPLLAAAAYGMSVLSMRNTLQRSEIPTLGVLPAMTTAVHQTWLGAGRYSTQFAAPVLLGLLAVPGRRHRLGRRLALTSLLLGPPLTTWWRRRPRLDAPRFVLGQLADDLAYGAGVWSGAVRERTIAPLRPSLIMRPLRIESLFRQRIRAR